MKDSSEFILDKHKFLIQILIAVIFALLTQFIINPLLIEPLTQQFPNILETEPTILITTLSVWFFSFSVAFFYYPENEFVNSYLLCSFLPLLVIVIREFIALFFFDGLHILPLIVVTLIVWKGNNTINLKYVVIYSPLLVIWFFTVRLIGINYPSFELNLVGILYIASWAIFNITLAYIITKMRE